MDKRRTILVAAVAVIVTMTLASCGKKKENTDDEMRIPEVEQSENFVDTMRLGLQDFNKQIVCNGQLRAKAKSDISFTTSDVVTNIYVRNGQRVSKGDIIASTDKREKTRELEKAEHELERSRVDLADKLISLGYDADLHDVPGDVMKRAEVTSGYYTAKYALQSAKTALDECNLRAPFSGRIVNVEGHAFQRNDKLCTLVDDSQFDVEFKILEAELPHVKVGQSVKVSPFIDEEKICNGVITQINPAVDEKGLILITARVDNTKGDKEMIDGLNVKVIVEQEVRKMFVVPKDAVVERDGYHVVFLYKDGRAVWTYVDVLYSNINSYAITGCVRKGTTVKEDDIVITSGNLNLADNTKVVARKRTDDDK